MAKDNSSPNVAKGVLDLEAKNVQINGLDVAIEQVRDGAIYVGGMAATAKVVKSSCLPIGAKLGATLGMGAASLIGYRMVQNNLSSTRTNTQGGLNVKVDKINSSVTASSSNNKIDDLYPAKSVIEPGDSSGGNIDGSIISSLDIEQLQLDFYLHIVIIYLLVLVLVFLVMKSFSKRNLKFEFVKKLPLGDYIQILFIKIFKWWDKTNILWVYLILIAILICMVISLWSISIILNNLN